MGRRRSGSTINLYPLTTGGLPSPITITASGTVDCLAIGRTWF